MNREQRRRNKGFEVIDHRPEQQVVEVKCSECEFVFEPKMQNRPYQKADVVIGKIEKGTEVFFACPECGAEYICDATNDKIDDMIQQLQILNERIKTVKAALIKSRQAINGGNKNA